MGPEDFAYPLPDAAIAQVPLEDRPAARLLDAVGHSVVHRTVRDLPSLLGPGDVLVVNDDDEIPGLKVSAASGATTETKGTAFFTVKLLSKPSSTVRLNLSLSLIHI